MAENFNFDITPEKRASIPAFLKRQLFRRPPPATREEVDLQGKTAIVTGSNTGLGLECARQLLGLGLSKLILAVRNKTKGEAARTNLLSGKLVKGQSIEVWELDLDAYTSITDFVERTKTLDRLDIFVHNAGMVKTTFELNKNTGHEEVFQVNYLSSVLLTVLLLPVLKEKSSKKQPGRLVLVSSETSAWAQFKEKNSNPLLPAFDKPEFFSAEQRYWGSKLLGQLFLSELVQHVPSSAAVINCTNPGLCYGSDLNRDSKGTIFGFVFETIKRVIGRSAATGAWALTDAAVKHGEESHGHYLEDGKLQPMAPIVYNAEGQRLKEILWQETMEELSFAGLSSIIQQLSI